MNFSLKHFKFIIAMTNRLKELKAGTAAAPEQISLNVDDEKGNYFEYYEIN